MRGLKDKRFVVAGGSAGIGAATAVRLGEEGAKVVVGSTNMEKLKATLAKIKAAGGEGMAVQFDFAEQTSADNLINTCVEAYGGIDGVANIGADLRHPSVTARFDLLDTPEDHWQRQFDCTFTGYVRTIKAAPPHMIPQRSGSIVNTASTAAFAGEEVRPAYASAKAAVNAMTRHIARRWGPDNIRCNSIVPGLVLVEKIKETMSSTAQEHYIKITPLQRAGEPYEVASAYAFLLSDDAAWVSGQAWSVNGGRTMRE